MIDRIVTAVAGFVAIVMMGLAFLTDSPNKRLTNGLREWHVGLLMLLFSPLVIVKGLVMGPEEAEE